MFVLPIAVSALLVQSELPNDAELNAGPSVAQNSAFGSSVASESDWVVVGATQSTINGPGEVQLFQRLGGAVFDRQATVGGAAAGDRFGAAVAVDIVNGVPVVLVGAPDNDQLTQDGGRATLFEFVGGALQPLVELAPGDPQSGSEFGVAVATDQEVYAVGRPDFGPGSVYLFDGSGVGVSNLPQVSPFDGQNQDLFGSAIGLDAGLLVVGSPRADSVGVDAGACYVFAQAQPGQPFQATTPLGSSKLVGAEVQAGHRFGTAVAAAGDLVVVGAPFDGGGAAYVFRRDAGGVFIQEQRLTAPALGPNAQFGASVAVEGDRIVVGAPIAFTSAGLTGAMVVFENAVPGSWDPVWTALDPDAGGNSLLGLSVDLAGDLAFAGAPQATVDGPTIPLIGAGLVGVFGLSGGLCLTDVLGKPTVGRADRFGSAVSLDGVTAAVGSPLDDGQGGASDSGSVSILTREGDLWIHQQLIEPNPPMISGNFGAALALDANELAIGAPAGPWAPFANGAVELWERVDASSPFAHVDTLQGEPFEPGDEFGASVLLDEDHLLVGAPGVQLDRGVVRSYVRLDAEEGFELIEELSIATHVGSERFGAVMHVGGERLVVGAPGADIAGSDSGAAYAYDRWPAAPFRWNVTDKDTPGFGTAWTAGDFVGADALVQLPDVDGNGIADIALDDSLDDGAGTNAGAFTFVMLDQDGRPESVREYTGSDFNISLAANDLFGHGIAVGQFDTDDPQLELAVGERGHNGGTGAIWILDFDDNWNGVDGTRFTSLDITGPAGTTFGSSIVNIGDVDGNGVDDLAVGMPNDVVAGNNIGAVWTLLIGNTPGLKTVEGISRFSGLELGFTTSVGDDFGKFMSLIEDFDGTGRPVLVVGDTDFQVANDAYGAVYLLDVGADGGLSLISRITQDESGFDVDLDDGQQFGRSPSGVGDIDGNGVVDLVVGSPDDSSAASLAGALWFLLMEADGTVLDEIELTADNLVMGDLLGANDRLGLGVRGLGDVDGDGAAELAVTSAGSASGAGRLWIMDLADSWFPAGELLPATASAGDRFGTSVAVDGSKVYVGGPGADGSLPNEGAIAVFEGDSGSIDEVAGESPLVSSSPAEGAGFGSSIALADDRFVIGAPGGASGVPSIGRAQLFERLAPDAPFVQTGELIAPDEEAGDGFASNMALAGSTLLVGAPTWDLGNNDEGAVYAYSLSGADCPINVATADFLSVTNGGPQTIFVEPGQAFAGQLYVTLASLGPGLIPIGPGLLLPLAPDPFFSLSLTQANTPPFVDTFGFLDAAGTAMSQILLPASLPGGLAGVQIHTAYVVAEFPSLTSVLASQATVVELVP